MVHKFDLRINIPHKDIVRLYELRYVPADTDDVVLIIENDSARLEYWFWGRKPDGSMHQRRTAGVREFFERGHIDPTTPLYAILGEDADPMLKYGALQLWPKGRSA